MMWHVLPAPRRRRARATASGLCSRASSRNYESRVEISEVREPRCRFPPALRARQKLGQPIALFLDDERPNQFLFFAHARSSSCNLTY